MPFFCHLQKVVAQQQEMNSLAQKRTAADDQSALMKELAALREQMVNNSQELKVGGTNIMWRCGQQKVIVSCEPLGWEALFFCAKLKRTSPPCS